MNNGNSRTKQGVLEKHDPLQTVQAPTASILAKSIKGGLYTMLQRESDARPAQKSTKRGFKAKGATITIAKRAEEEVSEVSPESEERVSQGVEQKLESGQGDG